MMRLKITLPREPKHTNSVLAVGWMGNDELVSAGDDQQLLKWDLMNIDAQLLMQLPSTLFPTDMHFYPRGHSRQQSNIFVLTSTEGKFYICNQNGRIEKVVEAHQGATLSGRWSHDGSSLITCGEDGAVKMWSRSGMLRSVLAKNGSAVYGICWSGDDSYILYCSGKYCFMKALKSQILPNKWKAHDGVVLCLDWSVNTKYIISGGEDCKYKVWDEYGRPIYCSGPHDYPITSVAWNLEGDLFAVGSFNLLRLCDKAGWSHSVEKLSTGSIYNISWSSDSTQLASACFNGSVLHAYLVGKKITWRNIEAIQVKRQLIDIRDISLDVAYEKLELRDRVTKFALGFEQLVVATTKQCYIFSARNWNTPIIMDLKECSVSLILLCGKYFLLADGSLMQVYDYEGRLQCMIKLPTSGTGSGEIREKIAAISNDTIAILDRMDLKSIHLFETTTGKSAGNGKLMHTDDIIEIAVDQCGPANGRKIAFINKNLDCCLALVHNYNATQKFFKIGTMVTNIRFNDQTNMLAGLQDNRLIVWLYPAIVFFDRDLLQKTVYEKNDMDFGKSPCLLTFVGNQISVKRTDGSIIHCSITPFPTTLIACVDASKWDQEDYLWAMLAVMAADAKNFYAAEIAYGALDEVEKVKFLSELRAEQSNDVRLAMMIAFTGNIKDADAMLVQYGHIFQAIMLNISFFRWQRALELATKHNMHLETVIGYRRQYLQNTERKETDRNFLQYHAKVEIDWDHIQEIIREDEKKDF